ncbi:MAG: hypothetical protein WCP09_01060 [Candidatus Taylorbacteria bacterium]
MSKKIKEAPPALRRPKITSLPPKPGARVNTDKALAVAVINNFDYESLILNLLTAMILFVALSIGLSFIDKSSMMTIGIPLIGVAAFVIIYTPAMWTTVNAREAKVYLDYFRPGKILVYLQGFHFTMWSSRLQEEPINFQKHEIITTRFGSENQVTFTTRDGYVMFANILILYNRKSDTDALSKSLRYQNAEIRAWILALVAARLSDLAGLNSVETLLYYKSSVVKWVSTLFDGEENISAFEDQIGCEIKNPTLENFDLTPESRTIYSSKSTIGMINEGIRALREANPDMGVNEASRTAAAAVDPKTTRTIEVKENEYRGIPQEGLTALGLGDGAGIVMAGKK